MNSSLSPRPQLPDLFPLEADTSQVEATSSPANDLPAAPSESPDSPNALSEDSIESVQSLYDPEPLEHLASNSLSPRGQVLFLRGVASLRAGETDTALEIWRQARAEFPSHAIIAHNLGLAAGAAQQYDEAIIAFRAASILDSSLIVSNLNGVCTEISVLNYQARADEILAQSQRLRAQKKCGEAEKILRQLLDEYPHSSAGLAEFSLVLACRSQGMPQQATELLAQALQHAQRAIFLTPTLPAAFAALSTAQGFLGTHREALASSQRFLELSSDPDSSVQLSTGEHALKASHSEANDQQLARTALGYADQVIATEPDNIRAWTLRADANSLCVLDGAVKFDQNLADFERILQLDPTNAHALELRDFLRAQCYQDEVIGSLRPLFKEAQAHIKANENEKALPLLQQILAEEPDNRSALSNLSLALRRLKRFDEAFSVQSHLARLDPTPESWRQVAAICLQSNKYEQANKAYLQVVELRPDEARSHRDVATTFEKMGRPRNAIPYWRRVLELTPEDQEAWFHLGKNLLDVGCAQRPVDESFVCEAIPALKKARVLDGGNTEIMSQLAVGIAEVGDSEMAFDYASRLAGHDPVAHSALMPRLTNIQSRRLSEGLASKPISSALVPLLIPPGVPVQHTGEPLTARAFTPIPTRSVSPWLVGIVGLLVIFGTWGAMQLLGYGYATPVVSVAPAPVWSQPSLYQPQSVAPPASFDAPADSPSPSYNTIPIQSWWKGTVSGEPARLFITRSDDNTFYGTIFIDSEDTNGLQVQINGVVSASAISWRETQILSNPHKTDWSLGEETGKITQRGANVEIGGTGKDSNGTYIWSFTRDLTPGSSSNQRSASINTPPTNWAHLSVGGIGLSLEHPVEWTSAVRGRGEQKSVSFTTHEDNVHLILTVSNTTASLLNSWQAADERLRRTYGSNYHLVNLGDTYLGGENGIMWQFILKQPGQTVLHKDERSVIHDGKRYTLLMTAPVKDVMKWIPIFEHIANSFSFNP